MVVAAIAVGAYLLVHLNDEIRDEVQRLLAEHYRHLDVRVGGARLIEGRGIEIRDLSFRARSATPSGPPLVEIDEVFLACPVHINQLFQGLPPLTQVVFHRPHFRATRLEDGSWDLGSLLPLPQAGKQPVEVVVKQGTVELAAGPANAPSTLVFREVTGAFRRTGEPLSNQNGTRGEVAFALTATTPLCEHVKLAGKIHPEQGRLRLRGRLDQLSLTRRDLMSLPAPFADAVEGLQHLRGSIRLETLEFHQPSEAPPQVAVTAHLEGVDVGHERLPDPVTGLTGEVAYQDDVLHAPRLSGTFGAAGLEISFRRHGWTKAAPFAVSATLMGFDLRERHWLALPESVRDIWQKYRAEGLIDITRCDVTFDGRELRPHLEVQCRDLSLLSEKFRYPLKHVRGIATIDPAAEQGHMANVRLRLEGEATAERPLAIEGEFAVDTSLAGSRGQPTGWLRVAG